jgi:hypothetical protein
LLGAACASRHDRLDTPGAGQRVWSRFKLIQEDQTLSHVVTIETQVRDPMAVTAACRRLGLPEPSRRTVRLFSGEATGLAVELPGWRYPAVCDTASGTVRFDVYEGRWGDRKHLDAFLQAYAVEVTKIEARRAGHTVTEQPLEDGSIKLTVQVNGGAA